MKGMNHMTTENKTMKKFDFMNNDDSVAYTCDIETGICGPVELNKDNEKEEDTSKEDI